MFVFFEVCLWVYVFLDIEYGYYDYIRMDYYLGYVKIVDIKKWELGSYFCIKY